MYRIITVCTGNICRSPMAQIMLANAVKDAGLEDQISVDSAGTTDWEAGRPIDPRAAKRLARAGLLSEAHIARRFETSWYRDRDLILALDADHFEELLRLAPDEAGRQKVRMFRSFAPHLTDLTPAEQGIYDPWFGDEADFDATWDMITSALPGILEHVRKGLDARR
jgi:protein-tyrosine phosphatase